MGKYNRRNTSSAIIPFQTSAMILKQMQEDYHKKNSEGE